MHRLVHQLSLNINGWLKQQKNSSHNKDINIETLLKIMHLRYMTLALWIYMLFCNLSYIYYCLQKTPSSCAWRNNLRTCAVRTRGMNNMYGCVGGLIVSWGRNGAVVNMALISLAGLQRLHQWWYECSARGPCVGAGLVPYSLWALLHHQQV